MLKEGPTLLVGLDDALPPPLQMGSPEAGDFHGFEVDMLQELARRMGVELRYRRALWSAIIDELQYHAPRPPALLHVPTGAAVEVETVFEIKS